jgi:hypothetical protein
MPPYALADLMPIRTAERFFLLHIVRRTPVLRSSRLCTIEEQAKGRRCDEGSASHAMAAHESESDKYECLDTIVAPGEQSVRRPSTEAEGRRGTVIADGHEHDGSADEKGRYFRKSD